MDYTILLVDDEAGIRKVLSISLADMGYPVVCAENGKKALEIFRLQSPDIVLTDIKMPGMDGLALLAEIHKESPDTPVIMITGHGDMELAVSSMKLGAVDFIEKPVDDDVLGIALDRAREQIIVRKKLKDHTINLERLVEEKSEQLVLAERQAAIGQAFESLSSAIWNVAGDIEAGIKYFNENPSFVSIHDKTLTVVSANKLHVTRLGGEKGISSNFVYRDKDLPGFESPVEKTFRTAEPQRVETVLSCKNGNDISVIVHTTPIKGRGGQPELVLEIATDISEIKRLKDEVRNVRHNYQQLFDEAPCYISVQDENCRIIEANIAIQNDFDPETGAFCYEVYKRRSSPCPDCPVKKTFAGGQSHSKEMIFTTSDGRQQNVLVQTAPIIDPGGRVKRVMLMAINITEIQILQDHLSSLGLLIGTISHGIKGLLAGLDGGSYLVTSGLEREDLPMVREGWGIVMGKIEKIRDMVLDILYYAKDRDLSLQNVYLGPFIADTARIVEPAAQKNGIAFRVEAPPMGEKLVFLADPRVLRSALVNILENGVDACVKDDGKDAHEIVFSAWKDQDGIIFQVRDNGVGMSEDICEDVFNLFFSSKGEEGTGLGLFIVEKSVEKHGGTVRVESQVGVGSCFTVAIPCGFDG